LNPDVAELLPRLRGLTIEDVIDQEKAGGQDFGPFHRTWLHERAPEKVRRYLELAAKHPGLVGMPNSPYQAPEGTSKAMITSNAAVTASATETNLWVPAFQTLIPAGSMEAGKQYEVKFGGVFTSTATQGVLTWTPRCGISGTPATNITLGASNATAPAPSLTNAAWFGEFTLSIRIPSYTASSCTGTGNGFVLTQGAAAATGTVYVLGGTVATTIDNTVNTGLIVSLTISVASQSYTCQWVTPSRSFN
jgi:hypothetical protein